MSSRTGRVAAGRRRMGAARADLDFLAGGGEMGELMRRHDWSSSSLGSPAQWPQSLRTATSIMLCSRHPMFVWWGRDLINLYNDAYRPVLGAKHPHSLGQPASAVWAEIWDLIGPRTRAVRERAESMFDEALLLIIERFGYPEETYFTFSYSPIRGEDGGVAGVFCAVTDDTRRVIGERRLRLLRELASTASETHSPEQLCGAVADCITRSARDLPFALLYLTEQAGNSARLVAQANMPPGMPGVEPIASLDTADAIWPLRQALLEGNPVVIENLRDRLALPPTGAWDRPPERAVVVPLREQAQSAVAGFLIAGLNPYLPFDEGYRGFVGLLADQIAAGIARARESAEHARGWLAAIIKSSNDAIVSKTLDGIITSWNPAAVQLFGYEPQEIIGKPITTIIPPELHAEEAEFLARLRRGERIEHHETVRTAKDGRSIEVALTISPIQDESGTIVGASKIARDIAAQKRAERALREADRRKDEFLALLGHELRNPLSPISTASELLSRTLAHDAPAQTSIDMIKRQAAHLTRLVDDLLDVGRITQGRIHLKRRPLDLASVIAQAIETVEPLFGEKQHQVAIVSSYQPLYVHGDFARLVQCMVNILTNAAKYTEQQGQIRIATRAEGPCAVIEVSDTGAGIAPELLPQIFDLFVQSDRTLDRAQGGLGIGLSVVKRLIEMHEGKVTAQSGGVGQGSTFVIELPRIARPEAAARPDSLRSPPRRVLIVDDNIDAANSLAMLLSHAGHETQVAYSGREALARVESFAPDVALLDIGLPEMDGYELASRLRAVPRLGSTRLVALTGYGQGEDKKRSQQAGFDDHLVKPADLPALERALAGSAGSVGPPRG